MHLSTVAAAAVLLIAVPAAAEEPHPLAPPTEPSSGLALLITGSLATAGGAVDLATAPICNASRIPAGQRSTCLDASVVSGLVLVAVGVPLVAIGAGQRSTWSTWLRGVTVAPTRAGASVGWGGSF